MPIHSGKAKVHFCLQIQTLLADQCELRGALCKTHSATNILKDKAQPALLLQEFVWIAVEGSVWYGEDFGGLYSYAPHKSYHHRPPKSRKGFSVCIFPHVELCAVYVTSLGQKFD